MAASAPSPSPTCATAENNGDSNVANSGLLPTLLGIWLSFQLTLPS
jgi:hypothetical protein